MARWFAFLQRFVFTVHHRTGEQIKVADALSRMAHSLTVLQLAIPAFDSLKEFYFTDDDFKDAWFKCWEGDRNFRFDLEDGFILFLITGCVFQGFQ